MKNELHNLLQKEMDRRDFLKHVGIGALAMTGATAFVKTLNSFGGPAARRSNGYGASTYGGNRSALEARR